MDEMHCAPQRDWWVRRAHTLTDHFMRLGRKRSRIDTS